MILSRLGILCLETLVCLARVARTELVLDVQATLCVREKVAHADQVLSLYSFPEFPSDP